MKVYTKRGDDGTTGLLYGGRVDKDDLRTSAYGTVDETVSALGMARAAAGEGEEEWAHAILVVQRELFVVGAQLATHVEHWPKLVEGVSLTTPAMVEALEERIDSVVERWPLPGEFVVPGASPVGAALDLARTICRRAERHVVAMQRQDLLPDDAPLHYLNRLSDYLYVLARAVEDGLITPTRD